MEKDGKSYTGGISPSGDYINPNTGEVEFTQSDIEWNKNIRKYVNEQTGEDLEGEESDGQDDSEVPVTTDVKRPTPQVPGQIVMPEFNDGTMTSYSPEPETVEKSDLSQGSTQTDEQETKPDDTVPKKVYKYKASDLLWADHIAESTGQSWKTVLLEHGINPDDVDTSDVTL